MFQLMVVSWLWAQFSIAGSWDGWNDPSKLDSNYEYRFSALPLSASMAPKDRPWSESYWPRNKGSINLRWNAKPPVGFGFQSPPRTSLVSMTRDQLAQLSPAEKFDLVQGHYDYPLATYVARNLANPYAHDYEGICDGWTASSMQFREPKPIDVANPDGMVIPFGASDVKGLMSYFAAQRDLGTIVVGRYCLTAAGLRLGTARCEDINPGAYHVILANELGLKGKPIAADIDPGKETWNQPVFGVEFQVLGSAMSDSAANAIRIHSKMHYTDELDQSLWDPVTGTSNFKEGVQESDYVLELDDSGRITGGYWLNDSHPDVFWRPTKPIVFEGEYEILNRLYHPISQVF